jgi:hypothetical protein
MHFRARFFTLGWLLGQCRQFIASHMMVHCSRYNRGVVRRGRANLKAKNSHDLRRLRDDTNRDRAGGLMWSCRQPCPKHLPIRDIPFNVNKTAYLKAFLKRSLHDIAVSLLQLILSIVTQVSAAHNAAMNSSAYSIRLRIIL